MRTTKLKVPAHIKEGIDAFVRFGRPTGHFLQAVLSNDLKETVNRADSTSERHLFDIYRYIYSYIPSKAHGSQKRYAEWCSMSDEAREEMLQGWEPPEVEPWDS